MTPSKQPPTSPRRRPLPYPRSGAESVRDGEKLSVRSPLDAIEAALGVIPMRQSVHVPRWVGYLAVSAIIGMTPWVIYLGFTLPAKVASHHYDVAWLGFDSALLLVLGILGYNALRRRPATAAVAAVAAAMLVIDAWFDLTTSTGPDFALALLLACVGEIPLAIICAWAAYHAERRRKHAYDGMRMRWQHAIDAARLTAFESGEAAKRRLSPPPAVPPSQ